MLNISRSNLNSLSAIIANSLNEDDAFSDITSDITIDSSLNSKFLINARQDLIFCGKEVIIEVFSQLKKSTKFNQQPINLQFNFNDGDFVEASQNIVSGYGNTKIILAGERTLLNLIQHLSAIATNTKKFIDKINNPNIKILDTRKTIPQLRELQKYAVRCAGGHNHRFNLSEMVLVKDNHIEACNGIENLQKKLLNYSDKKIEIECDKIEQIDNIIKIKPDVVMLDNFSKDDLIIAIKKIRNSSSSIKIEVSGGVNIENIANYADLDIDFISIGSLTNEIKIVDIGLDFI